jgi:basic membrane protein A
MDIPLINRFKAGYVAGARFVNPDVSVTVAYAGTTPNGFVDPVRGREMALRQYEQGVDVIYHASGGTGRGVIDAARESGKYAIGVDTNQNYLAPGHVLTSMIKRVDHAVLMTIRSAVEGNFRGGVRKFGLAEGGLAYAVDEYNEHLITEEMMTVLEEIKAQIISGEIAVPKE